MKRLTSLMLVLMLVLAGCSGQQANESNTAVESEEEVATSSDSSDSKENSEETILKVEDVEAEEVSSYVLAEAPMLSEMVRAGTLEAVADRLPVESDIFVENVEKVGLYGGAFSFAYTEAGWNTGKPIEQGLFRWKENGTVEPNVAKSYEVNDDATVYTIHLREGLKWSDGVPFTAEDCVFFYDHMCVPETFGKSLWDCFKVDNPETGETTIAKFDLVDDHTFTVSFEYPSPAFIEKLAINAKWCWAPKHYHINILPEFVGEEQAAEIAQEMGFSDVKAMGKNTGYYFWNVPGVPTLNPYILSDEDGKNDTNGEYYEFVRNPYYWKTDQAGNQLPYVDKIEYTKIADISQTLIKILAGEITIGDLGWKDIEIATENADSVGYHVVEWATSTWADVASQLQLNQTVADDDLRGLFRDIRFREALSVAVDREEYAALISNGWVEGKQASPPKGTQGYSEAWDSKWTEYSPENAESLLKDIGLVKGEDGYYDFADGKDLVLNITSFTSSGADDTYPVLKKYFDAVGIKTTYQPVDKDLLNNRLPSNDFEVILGPVAPAETVNITLRPDTLVPVRNYAAWYGQYGDWFTSGGEQGMEPEQAVKDLLDLYTELQYTADVDERNAIGEQMLKLHEENQWIIGYMASASKLYTVDNNLVNFKENSVFSDEFRGMGIAHIDICFFSE